MENKSISEIRFSGFNEKWDIKKLNDIADKVSVGIATSSSEHFTDKNTGVPFIKNQNIKQNRIDDSCLEYISKEFDKANINKRVQAGDILTARTGYPGLSAVVPPHLNGAQTFTTLITRLKKGVALAEFVAIYINSDIGMKQITGMEAGGAQKNVNAGILKNLTVPLPSLQEQKIISKFVTFIEKTISIQQQELDTLKQTKQGFLQKMFPKEGEIVPELRFPGFSQKWNQKKLGDIGSVSMCKRIFKHQTTENGEIPFFKIGTFGRTPNSYISRELFEEFRNKYPYPEIGDVLISASGTIGRTVVYKGEEAYYQDSNIVWLKRNKELVENSFLQQFFQIVKWAGTEGSTIQRLYNNNILRTEISLPSIEEQVQIGNFLKQLDDLITLQQQELDALKQTKKAFLQKMFV
ncbi:restriction endonuclease subunit S [Planococcus rifietoensis]|uniref:restriction endonuclease subunit S n=1 Tax=Planococcus rifietoensis TaxID=200991 RepID=UPI00384FA32A